ncbi:MAG TPA: hypothetical protein VGH87_27560 [Polyangiaceae bacterium]|jgi:hypothetical protein|nr:hypothetical protein [Polyangiaceae bacterium]
MQIRVGIIALALLCGCGKELARIPLAGEGEGDATVTASSGQKLALWTSLDIDWDGAFAARYAVELRDATGKAVASATCDPLDVSVRTMAYRSYVGTHHTDRYQGKMQCEIVAPTGGTFKVHAKLTYSSKPSALTVKDISLVVKS